MRTATFVALCSVLVATAFSQITITSSDYQKTLGITIHTTTYVSSDTSGLAAVLAASGVNKTWNLTGRTYTQSATGTSTLLDKSASGAPSQGTSAFSSANFVIRRTSSSKPQFTDWTYLTVASTALSYCGYASDSLGILKSLQTNVPAQRSQSFPTTYPGSWTWSSTVTSSTYGPGGSVGVGVAMSGSDVVDGYGTVITPEGNFSCLRIRRRTDISFGFFTITSYSYDFVDQNRSIARLDGGSTGSIPGSPTYYTQGSATGFGELAELVPREPELLQNFPNPFNPSTTIQFGVPKTSFVTLKIYNTLGHEIKTLVSSTLSAGRYWVTWHASDVSSGIYFCRMKADGFTKTRKVALIK